MRADTFELYVEEPNLIGKEMEAESRAPGVFLR